MKDNYLHVKHFPVTTLCHLLWAPPKQLTVLLDVQYKVSMISKVCRRLSVNIS